MRILQVTQSLGNGGAEKFVVELSNEQARSNQVTLVSLQPLESWMYPPRSLSPSVLVIELGFRRKYSIAAFLSIFRLIQKENPEIIHIHSSLLMPYFIFLPFFFRKQQYFHTIHNTITPAYYKLFHLFNSIRFVNNRFKHICISESICKDFTHAFPKLKFERINNGIMPMATTPLALKVKEEIQQLKPTAATRVFIAVGNYSMLKNFVMLAKVFNRLHFKGMDAILLIIGREQGEEQIRYREVEAIHSPNTFQLGSKQNVADYLAVADALLMSSTHEGMPLVVLEAFSMGVPVISTPAGGVSDLIINGFNGILSPSFTENDLLSCILNFMHLPDYDIKKMKEGCNSVFKSEYHISICNAKYLQLYAR